MYICEQSLFPYPNHLSFLLLFVIIFLTFVVVLCLLSSCNQPQRIPAPTSTTPIAAKTTYSTLAPSSRNLNYRTNKRHGRQ